MCIYTHYARNRTHVCMRGGAAACAPIPTSHTSTRMYLYIHACIFTMHAYIYIQI